jgi:hypothetical protein
MHMLSGAANFASVFGYTNASWTAQSRFDLRLRVPGVKPHGPKGAREVRPNRFDDGSGAFRRELHTKLYPTCDCELA